MKSICLQDLLNGLASNSRHNDSLSSELEDVELAVELSAKDNENDDRPSLNSYTTEECSSTESAQQQRQSTPLTVHRDNAEECQQVPPLNGLFN